MAMHWIRGEDESQQHWNEMSPSDVMQCWVWLLWKASKMIVYHMTGLPPFPNLTASSGNLVKSFYDHWHVQIDLGTVQALHTENFPGHWQSQEDIIHVRRYPGLYRIPVTVTEIACIL